MDKDLHKATALDNIALHDLNAAQPQAIHRKEMPIRIPFFQKQPQFLVLGVCRMIVNVS